MDNSDEVSRVPQERISFDRLRERTDELELLISGLSMVALFTLPELLVERYYDSYTQMPLAFVAAALGILPIGIAIAYLLATSFLVHLLVRAFWVGLIGLHASFPEGIRWDRLPGPILSERLRGAILPLPKAIAAADRVASILYSLIILIAVILMWAGFVFTCILVLAFLAGQAFNATNFVLGRSIDLVVYCLIGNVLICWLLDSVLARRWPALAGNSVLRAIVLLTDRVNRIMVPDRLVGAVRLTLQTQTAPRTFNAMLLVVLLLLPILGTRYFRSQLTFDAFGTHQYVDATDTRGGIRSQHYAALRTGQDRLRAWPVIPDRIIQTDFTTLLLPYMPMRDDPVIAARCPDLDRVDNRDADIDAAEAVIARSRATASCMARLWEVRLDGAVLDLAQGEIAERAELGLRGLELVVDLRQGQPGTRMIEVVWRPRPEQDPALDDYVNRTVYMRIPLVWAPDR